MTASLDCVIASSLSLSSNLLGYTTFLKSIPFEHSDQSLSFRQSGFEATSRLVQP